jgi:hypothetical protein
MKNVRVGVVAAMAIATAAVFDLRVVSLAARGRSQTPSGQHEKTAAEAFKNIQVFKDLPESQLIQAMFFMKSSLGVSCTHCHVDFVSFEKDDKPAKAVARDMIRMVQALNAANFGGRNAVTCNTCHRGQSRPSAPLAFAPPTGQRPAENRSAAPPGAAIPTVDQVFDRYIEAAGGRTAQEHVATLRMTGSMMSSEGWTAPLEIDAKSPGKSLSTFELQGPWRTSFNGTAGWSQDNQGVHALDGSELALFRLKSSFYRPQALKALYSGLVFVGTDTIGGHVASVVEGRLTGAGVQRLFFETESGLLVRVTASTETPFGPLPEEFDLEDYRSVGAVKLPFVVSDLKPDFSSVDRVEKVQTNVPIDDVRFERPAGKR